MRKIKIYWFLESKQRNIDSYFHELKMKRQQQEKTSYVFKIIFTELYFLKENELFK